MAIERDTNSPERAFSLSLAPMRLAELFRQETGPVRGKALAAVYFGLPIAAGVVYAFVHPGDPWIIAAPAGVAIELIGARIVTSQ